MHPHKTSSCARTIGVAGARSTGEKGPRSLCFFSDPQSQTRASVIRRRELREPVKVDRRSVNNGGCP